MRIAAAEVDGQARGQSDVVGDSAKEPADLCPGRGELGQHLASDPALGREEVVRPRARRDIHHLAHRGGRRLTGDGSAEPENEPVMELDDGAYLLPGIGTVPLDPEQLGEAELWRRPVPSRPVQLPMADGGHKIVDDRQRAPVSVQQGGADDPLIGVEQHEGNADRADRDAQVLVRQRRAAGNDLRQGGCRGLGPCIGIEGALIVDGRRTGNAPRWPWSRRLPPRSKQLALTPEPPMSSVTTISGIGILPPGVVVGLEISTRRWLPPACAGTWR